MCNETWQSFLTPEYESDNELPYHYSNIPYLLTWVYAPMNWMKLSLRLYASSKSVDGVILTEGEVNSISYFSTALKYNTEIDLSFRVYIVHVDFKEYDAVNLEVLIPE